jgi:putative DNA primase/helicase
MRISPEAEPGAKAIIHLHHADHGSLGKLELLVKGQHLVVAGEHPATRRNAEWWSTSDPDTKHRAPIVGPCIPLLATRAAVDAVVDRVLSALASIGVTYTRSKSEETSGAADSKPVPEDRAAPSTDLLLDVLRRMPNPATADRHAYTQVMLSVAGCIRAGKQLKTVTMDDEKQIVAEAAKWAARWEGPTPSSAAIEEAKIRSDFLKREVIYAGWPTLRNVATDLGVRDIRHKEAIREFEVMEPPEPVEEKPRGPLSIEECRAIDKGNRVEELVELEVVKVFAPAFKDLFKYDHDTKAWFIYDDAIGWRLDVTRRVEHLARLFVRGVRNIELRQWTANELRASGKIAFSTAVCRACASEPVMATRLDDWNADEDVLGIPGGYVDLRTGTVMPPQASDMIRFRTTVAPADTADCPLWRKFLAEMTNGDLELLAWTKRFCGYLLTGSIKEERLLFLFGPGGNGKGVFLKTIGMILGDYTYQCAAEFFNADSRINRQPQIAQMAAKRLVISSELEQGARLAETLLKDLSGNDFKIKGTALYAAAIEFELQAKIILVGNHAPKLRGVDEALMRRLDVLGCVFKPEKRDPNLKSKLQAEGPQILRWMVEGAVDWYQNGLGTCAAITRASAEYFETQDIMSEWIEECCDRGPGLEVSVLEARQNYNSWLRARRESTVNAKELEAQFFRKGIFRKTDNRGGFYEGLALQSAPEFVVNLDRTGEPEGLTIH